MDIYTLSAAMGHSLLQVTTGYLRAVSQRALRELSVSPLDSMNGK